MSWYDYQDKEITTEEFNKLFREFYNVLCIFAFQYLNNLHEAEDLVESYFVWFLEKKRGTKFTGSMKSYLFGAIRKSAITKAKELGRHLFVDIEDKINETLYDTNEEDEESLEVKKQKLYQEIENLPHRRKEVFKAIVLEDLSYKQTAQKLNISENSVKTHYSLALKQLRKQTDIILLIFMSHI